MSRLTDAFATVGVHNGWDYARGNVTISYTPAVGAGGWREPAKWQVVKGTERTDDAPRERQSWQDRGLKTWTVFSAADKAKRLEQAKAWVSERYGIKEFARTPYGDWMDADFVTKRTAELKAKTKAATVRS